MRPGPRRGIPYAKASGSRRACRASEKLCLPIAILDKPGPLSAEEWQVVQRHPIFAADAIRQVPTFAQVAEIVLARYEHWDGSGYPHGLSGHRISWAARAPAVAGSIDAMCEPRPYRLARTVRDVLRELRDGSESQFDPHIVMQIEANANAHALTTLLRDGCPHTLASGEGAA